MTGTLAWLETYNQAGAALSFVIEGFGTVFATASMPSTYSADSAPYNQWGDPTGGLMAEGVIGSKINLYAQDIEAETLAFTVVDSAGLLAASMFREQYSSGKKTYLTANVLAGATSNITVQSSSAFASSGTIYIGDEAIGYTAKPSSTEFGTITRGKFAINRTNTPANFGASHLIGNNVTTSATTAPAVTDYIKTWYGRFVHLFLHIKDPLTGVYNKPSEACKVWSGRIENYDDLGDGKIQITAKSAIELLKRQVGNEQWTARMDEGMKLDGTMDTLYLVNTQTTAYNLSAALAFSGIYTHAAVVGAIQGQINTWSGSVHAGDLWSLTLIDPGEGKSLRYRFRLEANTTAVPSSNKVCVGLHPKVWKLLGWPEKEGGHLLRNTTTNDQMLERDLRRKTDNLWELEAPESPIIYSQCDLVQNMTVQASSQTGTFITQTVSDTGVTFAPDVNGLIEVKGGVFDSQIYAVTYTAGSPAATLKIYARLNKTTGKFTLAQLPEHTPSAYIRLGEASSAPLIKQVWYEHGPAGQVLLRALLSTGGASGYNHATYDVRTTVGFGASVPASLIDIPSWEEMDDVTLQFVVSEPRPFYEFLEPVLQVSNRYVVWKSASQSTNPKLAIVRPTLDNTTNLVWELTESNKCQGKNGADRIKVSRAADGIINRVIVKYGHGLDGDESRAMTWIIEDVASQSDYGRRRTVTLNAPTVTNVEHVAPMAVGPALAYCSRPLAIAERSFNASLIRMAPGDAVSVADNYIIDPTTGTRGGVVYGWILGTQFDLATGQGRARIVFLPEKLPRVQRWAPSARINEAAAGGGYDAGTKTITCKINEFSDGSEAGDTTHFSNGDKVHIYSLDEDPPTKEWNDTCNGGGGSTQIVLTTGLAGFDSTKRYVIEFDDILTVQSSQRTRHAYIADDADLSTGGAIPTPYDWGTSPTFTPDIEGAALAAIDYSQGMFKPNSTYDDKGEPMSIHKVRYLVKAANNLYGYKTRQTYINQYFNTAPTQTGTTTKLVFVAWIPIYGHTTFLGSRGLTVRVYGKQAGGGTATFVVRSAPSRPEGTSFTSFSFPFGSTSASFATTSSTLAWSSELSLTCSPMQSGTTEGSLPGTWITVECSGSAGGITATLQGLWVAEVAL